MSDERFRRRRLCERADVLPEQLEVNGYVVMKKPEWPTLDQMLKPTQRPPQHPDRPKTSRPPVTPVFSDTKSEPGTLRRQRDAAMRPVE
jgi:hypothetical protein